MLCARTRRSPLRLLAISSVLSVLAGSTGCSPVESNAATMWSGTMDTLASGAVLVSNPRDGVWDERTAWHVIEQVRIGTLEGDGPDMFGGIGSIEVDQNGNIYVYDRQALELRVFDPTGEHIRTVGREGGGPGEFKQVIGMDWAPDGTLWVVDPGNNRISVFDTSGTYVTSHRTIGNVIISPWPGGFDTTGTFYNYGIDTEAEAEEQLVMVRYDANMEPADTFQMPRYDAGDAYFELRTANSFWRMSIPFMPGMSWQLARTGDIWFGVTGDYRLYKTNLNGDTLRIVSREYQPIAVTEADVERELEGFDDFLREGGKVDRSRIPKVKPAFRTFFLDDANRLWVMPMTSSDDEGRLLDVFDSEGRYLGRVELPFAMQRYPLPIFRNGRIYAVTRGDLDVPYVVSARIGMP
jgi:hypothetical protein